MGDFYKGKKQGKGKWKQSKNQINCNTYDGDYFQDQKHGQGVYTWASGNIYKGDYNDDERPGNGQMLWTDGSMYEGEWHKGIQHGFGRMIFPDGSQKEGYFENNVFKYPVEGNDSKTRPAPSVKSMPRSQAYMRSTKASSGFQSDAINAVNQNPYQLNQLGRPEPYRPPLAQLDQLSGEVEGNKGEYKLVDLPQIEKKNSVTNSLSKSQTGHRSLSNHPSSHKSGGTLNNLIYSPNPPRKALDKSYNSTQGSNLKNHIKNKQDIVSRDGNIVIGEYLQRERQNNHDRSSHRGGTQDSLTRGRQLMGGSRGSQNRRGMGALIQHPSIPSQNIRQRRTSHGARKLHALPSKPNKQTNLSEQDFD